MSERGFPADAIVATGTGWGVRLLPGPPRSLWMVTNAGADCAGTLAVVSTGAAGDDGEGEEAAVILDWLFGCGSGWGAVVTMGERTGMVLTAAEVAVAAVSEMG